MHSLGLLSNTSLFPFSLFLAFNLLTARPSGKKNNLNFHIRAEINLFRSKHSFILHREYRMVNIPSHEANSNTVYLFNVGK